MSDQIFLGKSAHEYFREMVTDVVSHRRIKIQEITEFYLVDLLAKFLESEHLFVQQADGSIDSEPLAFMLMKALESEREQRFQQLKRLGDTSLFVSGFFGDSLANSLVDVDYYIAMGGRAYDALKDASRGGTGKLDVLYGELSDKFGTFVDIFAEISELSQLRSNRGLLKLYERFLNTRSERVARMLQQRGVALFAGPASVNRLAEAAPVVRSASLDHSDPDDEDPGSGFIQ